MPTAHLNDRALVSIAGPDAEHFLQNIVTTDVVGIAPGDVWPGALLTPQGKIMFDFLVSRRGEDGFLLECRSDFVDDFVRRLTLYKLRSKLEITKLDQSVVAVAWQDDSPASQSDSGASQTDSSRLRDRRFPEAANVVRHHDGLPAADASEEDYTALRIAHGVAESGSDYALGDAFPHDILFDQNGGVGLKKGCFVGQEVVSRMHHRGTARRRLLIAAGETALPAPGTDITAEGRSVGTLGSVAGAKGLAIARIDKVKSAMDGGVPLMAGASAVTLSIPTFAKFGFPEKSAGAEAD
jgi:folate-binding protein YgfZ